MKRIGVIANSRKPRAAEVLQRLNAKARTTGLSLYVMDDTARLLPGAKRISCQGIARKIDALMALGGDGTVLHAIRMLKGADVPVLGVNLGSLGFMTSVTLDDLEHAVDVLASGQFVTSERMLLDCRVLRRGRILGRYQALNDIVVGWGTSPRLIMLELTIDGEPVTSFACDGLILSTPTGSTGHSLSAGGPILSPDTQAFVISVICPHTLSNRPLVVPSRSAIRIRITQTQKRLLLSVDGQDGQDLVSGDELEIRQSGRSARFIHLPGYSYFSVLRQKLHWRGSSV